MDADGWVSPAPTTAGPPGATRRPAHRPRRRHRRPAAGPGAAPATAGCSSATRTAGCSRSTRATGAVEVLTTLVARAADGVLQQRRRAHAAATIWFSDSSAVLRHRPLEGRPVEDTRPGGCCGGRRTARSRWCSTGCRFAERGGAVRGRVLRRRRRDRRADRRTPLADRPPAGRARPPRHRPAGLSRQHQPRQRRAVWVTIASPTDPVARAADDGAPVPVRRLAWRLPARLQPRPEADRARDRPGRRGRGRPRPVRRGVEVPPGHRRAGAPGGSGWAAWRSPRSPCLDVRSA